MNVCKSFIIAHSISLLISVEITDHIDAHSVSFLCLANVGVLPQLRDVLNERLAMTDQGILDLISRFNCTLSSWDIVMLFLQFFRFIVVILACLGRLCSLQVSDERDGLLTRRYGHHLAPLHYVTPVVRLQWRVLDFPHLLLVLQIVDLVPTDPHTVHLQAAHSRRPVSLLVKDLLSALLLERDGLLRLNQPLLVHLC